MSSANIKCPVCSNILEDAELSSATKQLEKRFLQKYRDHLKKGKQENVAVLLKLKEEQRKQMKAMTERHQTEKKLLQKRFVEQVKKSRESQKHELVQLRRNYQTQLEQMRDFYGMQNAALQNELKTSFSAQLEAMKENYEGLAARNQKQFEALHRYIEDKLAAELRENNRPMGEDKMSDELRLSELVQQLDQRNAEIVALKQRLSRMADTIPEDLAQAPNPTDVQEQGGDQQEILRMLKEVAQQQQTGELSELEDDVSSDEEERRGFWGKSGKKFGLF